MKKRWDVVLKRSGIIAILIGLPGIAAYSWHRHTYPYGASHCCILAMGFGLMEYAETHGGRFPQGEASPEASLSLLFRDGLVDANSLRGMTVPEKTTRRILESGQLLDPMSCGWHYVEGLTNSDNPQLALLWCKEPLAHNGSRLKNGSREVITVDGFRTSVPAAGWLKFLKDQERMMEQRGGPGKSGNAAGPGGD